MAMAKGESGIFCNLIGSGLAIFALVYHREADIELPSLLQYPMSLGMRWTK